MLHNPGKPLLLKKSPPSKNKIEVVLKPLLLLLLKFMSGSRSHEALVPAGLHGPVRFSLDPNPNHPAASLTHSGETNARFYRSCVLNVYFAFKSYFKRQNCRFGARNIGEREIIVHDCANYLELIIFWL